MKNTIIWIGIFVLIEMTFSCSGVKSIPAEESEVKQDTVSEKGIIDDQRQQEFEYLFVEALKQKMLGDTQKTIQLLSSCLEINPNSSAAMFELANIYAANKDFTSSSLLLEKAISIEPQNKWYKLLLAQIYQQVRKYTDAANIYTELLKNDPENLEYLYMKAALLANAKEYNEAIETYNLLEQKTGINDQISVAKEELYLASGNVEKAFAEIEKLIESNPSETRYYGLLADLYQEQGDHENALKYYNKILELDPENGYVHFSLTNYYLDEGDTKKALEEAKKGFVSDDVQIQTKLQMYMMLTTNQDQITVTDQQNMELIQILLDNYPDEFLVHTIYADYLLKKNELDKARTALLNAININAGDYEIWQRVLFIDNELQQWDKLYEHSKNAMDLFPNQPQTYFLNAVACLQLDNLDETITIADEGLVYVVDNPQLEGQFLMMKGEAIYKKNNLEEAFKLFDRAVELDPNNFIALNNYAYYLSLTGRNLDKAEKMIGKVVEQFPDNPTYLDTYAWVLFKKGDYSLAKFYMQSALDNGGQDNPTLLEHYGDILFMMQKLQEAKQYWEKARENGGVSEVLDRKIKEQKYFDK